MVVKFSGIVERNREMAYTDVAGRTWCKSSPKVIAGEVAEGNKITVELALDQYERVVRYRKDCGLYIVIHNTMYFEYEFIY